MMNHHIRDMMDQFQNPFKLKHIRSLTNQADDFDVFGPSVVMASPGFLQSGVSVVLVLILGVLVWYC